MGLFSLALCVYRWSGETVPLRVASAMQPFGYQSLVGLRSRSPPRLSAHLLSVQQARELYPKLR